MEVETWGVVVEAVLLFVMKQMMIVQGKIQVEAETILVPAGTVAVMEVPEETVEVEEGVTTEETAEVAEEEATTEETVEVAEEGVMTEETAGMVEAATTEETVEVEAEEEVVMMEATAEVGEGEVVAVQTIHVTN